MVQCCYQYHFTFYFCESNFTDSWFYVFCRKKLLFWYWSTWFLQVGISFLAIQPFLYKLSHKYRQTNMWKHCENEMISTSRTLDKKKNLSSRQYSNLSPPKHRVSALSTLATENSLRERQHWKQCVVKFVLRLNQNFFFVSLTKNKG